MTRDWLESRIEKVTESGCWIWQGAINGYGYGQYRNKGRISMVHRYAYEEYIGPIKSNMHIDHLCRVRCCVNPSHLEVVSNRSNVMRGEGPSAINARKTHCIRGHEFTPGNTIISKHHKSGLPTRRCRACNKMHCSLYDRSRRVSNG